MGKTYKMSNFYETITQLSHNLSISEKQEIFDDIFEFLQSNFHIDALKIYLKKMVFQVVYLIIQMKKIQNFFIHIKQNLRIVLS